MSFLLNNATLVFTLVHFFLYHNLSFGVNSIHWASRDLDWRLNVNQWLGLSLHVDCRSANQIWRIKGDCQSKRSTKNHLGVSTSTEFLDRGSVHTFKWFECFAWSDSRKKPKMWTTEFESGIFPKCFRLISSWKQSDSNEYGNFSIWLSEQRPWTMIWFGVKDTYTHTHKGDMNKNREKEIEREKERKSVAELNSDITKIVTVMAN